MTGTPSVMELGALVRANQKAAGGAISPSAVGAVAAPGGLADQLYLATKMLETAQASKFADDARTYAFETEATLAEAQAERDTASLVVLFKIGDKKGGMVASILARVKVLKKAVQKAKTAMAASAVESKDRAAAVATRKDALAALDNAVQTSIGQERAATHRVLDGEKIAKQEEKITEEASKAKGRADDAKAKARAEALAARREAEAKVGEETGKAKVAVEQIKADAQVRMQKEATAKEDLLAAEHKKLLDDEARIEVKEKERTLAQESEFDSQQSKMDEKTAAFDSDEAAARRLAADRAADSERLISKNVVDEVDAARVKAQEVAKAVVSAVADAAKEANLATQAQRVQGEQKLLLLKSEAMSEANAAQDKMRALRDQTSHATTLMSDDAQLMQSTEKKSQEMVQQHEPSSSMRRGSPTPASMRSSAWRRRRAKSKRASSGTMQCLAKRPSERPGPRPAATSPRRRTGRCRPP